MNYIKSQSCSTKKTVLNNLAKLIEKCFCWSLFLINLQAYKPELYYSVSYLQILLK